MLSANYRFIVRGAASTDLVLRLLNLFAQQGLTVERVFAKRLGDIYHVVIELENLQPDRANVMIEKMRAQVLVSAAELQVRSGHQVPA